jgi:antitoxin ParD1/3/4
MATTSLSLGEHWETFIKQQISTGRYGSASEVVRDALRDLEVKEQKLAALRAELSIGYQQAKAGIFVENFSFDEFIRELDEEE